MFYVILVAYLLFIFATGKYLRRRYSERDWEREGLEKGVGL